MLRPANRLVAKSPQRLIRTDPEARQEPREYLHRMVSSGAREWIAGLTTFDQQCVMYRVVVEESDRPLTVPAAKRLGLMFALKVRKLHF